MKFYPIASRWALLFLFTITVVESDAMPLTMRQHTFDHPSLLASYAFRHALMSSRMLALLPRNHESQYGEYDSNYDEEGYSSEEGTRDNSGEHQQEDSDGNKEEMEGIGMSRGHRHSSSGPGNWDEGTSRTSDGSREGSEDGRYGAYSHGSSSDSEVNRFPHGSSYAPMDKASRPEHNHPVSGGTQYTSEPDEGLNLPQTHSTGDQPHKPDPASYQAQEPTPEETSPSEHAASSSLTDGDTPSMVCSVLSRLYRRLGGPVWYNQEGWKDTTTPHRIRTRHDEGFRESQHRFSASGQMEKDATDGQDGGQGDKGSINSGMTSNSSGDPPVVKEDNSGPSCCSWFGVTCRDSRVVGLALAGNGLDGPYPTDIVQSMVYLETV